MDLITISTTAAVAVPTIAAVGLFFDRRALRKRITVLNRRVGYAEDLHGVLAGKIEGLECQAASDGNRLSQLRAEKAGLIQERDAAEKARIAAEVKAAELQPLADKALAAQAQRVRASQAAKAKRDARRSQAA